MTVVVGWVGGDGWGRRAGRVGAADVDPDRREVLGVVRDRRHCLHRDGHEGASVPLRGGDRALFAHRVPDVDRVRSPLLVEPVPVGQPVLDRWHLHLVSPVCHRCPPSFGRPRPTSRNYSRGRPPNGAGPQRDVVVLHVVSGTGCTSGGADGGWSGGLGGAVGVSDGELPVGAEGDLPSRVVDVVVVS